MRYNNMPWIDREPKRMYKKFIKEFKNGGYFNTIKGENNEIERIDNKYIYIKCKSKDSSYKIRRNRLEEAINILYYKKSLKRSDLSKQSNYNTSLMGILLTIFNKKVNVVKDMLDKRSYKVVLKGVRYIPSGMSTASAKDWILMKKAGVKIVMVSYAHIRKNISWYCWCTALNMLAIVDSGAFTIAQKKAKGKKVLDIDIKAYSEYINKYKNRIWGYINLDVIGDAKKSRENYNFLKENTCMAPIPVWHPNSEIDNSNWAELDRMVKESDMIAIGGTHKSFFTGDNRKGDKKRELFRRINSLYPDTQFHYMGGSSALILEDLWEYGQADSTGWTYPRRNKQLYTFSNGRYGKATSRRPEYMSPIEAMYFSLINLLGFEEDYNELYSPSININEWNSRYTSLNIEEEIENEAKQFKSIIKDMRKKFKDTLDNLKYSFLDNQLEWDV